MCDNAREVEMEKNECFLLSRFVRSENGVFVLSKVFGLKHVMLKA